MSENLIVTYNKSGSKLAAYLPNEKEGFIVVLRKIATAHGVSNITADDIDYADTFIFKFYSDLTQFEIVYAFELYAAGKLAMEKKKEWNANFNIEFIGAVLNAYKVYREPVLAQQKKAPVEKQIEKAPARTLTYMEAQIEDGMQMDRVFKRYMEKEGKVPVAGNFEAAFDYLVDAKEIEMTKEQMIEFKEGLRDRLFIEYKSLSDNVRMSHDTFTSKIAELDDEKQFKKICREERAKQYYREYLMKKKNETAQTTV